MRVEKCRLGYRQKIWMIHGDVGHRPQLCLGPNPEACDEKEHGNGSCPAAICMLHDETSIADYAVNKSIIGKAEAFAGGISGNPEAVSADGPARRQ
jgi:hypothetical protein